MSNMEQQMVIKVPMSGEKNRTKVLTIVAKTHGVTSVAIKGPDGDWVVVTGNRVDSAELTRSLRKKIGDATIVSVQSINERVREEEDRCCYATSNNCDQYYPQPHRPTYHHSQPHCPVYYKVVDDPYPSYNNCSIL
ncbi:hypothetical protein Dsin_007675 [Dipteronia sinensis]|uniref:HMA domain-containing protein n=1 Tax=Dipteronia sinensis TaxID=43782 RepID=A0AAE0EGP5_9ROSI|nr:hypothetical protein Dsin_007675 [Dipteronia sinensis]